MPGFVNANMNDTGSTASWTAMNTTIISALYSCLKIEPPIFNSFILHEIIVRLKQRENPCIFDQL